MDRDILNGYLERLQRARSQVSILSYLQAMNALLDDIENDLRQFRRTDNRYEREYRHIILLRAELQNLAITIMNRRVEEN